MKHGQRFCDLAYAALSREEMELAEFAEQTPDDALSIAGIGEAAIIYLIRKQALRRRICIGWEVSYNKGKDKVDLCVLDDAYRPMASFELKVAFEDPQHGDWDHVREDVAKHFNPENGIKDCCEDHERYNALLFISNSNDSKDVIEGKIMKQIGDLIRPSEFVISHSIKLNRLKNTSRLSESWNHMRVVVFSGEYVGAQAAPAS